MNYFVLYIENDVDPSLIGPFGNEEKRDAEARRLRAESDEHGIYALEVTPEGTPTVRSYGASEIDPDILEEDDTR